jgi:hypothetical protein
MSHRELRLRVGVCIMVSECSHRFSWKIKIKSENYPRLCGFNVDREDYCLLLCSPIEVHLLLRIEG